MRSQPFSSNHTRAKGVKSLAAHGRLLVGSAAVCLRVVLQSTIGMGGFCLGQQYIKGWLAVNTRLATEHTNRLNSITMTSGGQKPLRRLVAWKVTKSHTYPQLLLLKILWGWVPSVHIIYDNIWNTDDTKITHDNILVSITPHDEKEKILNCERRCKSLDPWWNRNYRQEAYPKSKRKVAPCCLTSVWGHKDTKMMVRESSNGDDPNDEFQIFTSSHSDYDIISEYTRTDTDVKCGGRTAREYISTT